MKRLHASRSICQASVLLLAAGAALAQDFEPHVYLGRIPCEARQTVNLRVKTGEPGHYVLQFNQYVFNMHLVSTPSGAVRLEDEKAGTIWIQLNSKSMLMDQKRGLRLADECQHPSQQAMAKAMKSSPPVNLLNLDEPSR